MGKKATAGKDKKRTSGAGLFDSALASSVKESAQQIWLAGMGAFAKAQAEGKQAFDALVKEGSTLQQRTRSVAEERFGDVASRMSNMAGDVGTKAGKQWDKLESIVEERTAQAMKRLGVPSAKDVEALKQRIDELAAQLARGTRTGARKTATRTAAKSAAGKTAKRARKTAT